MRNGGAHPELDELALLEEIGYLHDCGYLRCIKELLAQKREALGATSGYLLEVAMKE